MENLAILQNIMVHTLQHLTLQTMTCCQTVWLCRTKRIIKNKVCLEPQMIQANIRWEKSVKKKKCKTLVSVWNKWTSQLLDSESAVKLCFTTRYMRLALDICPDFSFHSVDLIFSLRKLFSLHLFANVCHGYSALTLHLFKTILELFCRSFIQ